jgi:hypothetical protein
MQEVFPLSLVLLKLVTELILVSYDAAVKAHNAHSNGSRSVVWNMHPYLPSLLRRFPQVGTKRVRDAACRLRIIIILILVEFQEVQCFFVIGFQIATALTFSNEAAFLASINSFGSAIINSQEVPYFALSCIIPVLLVQAELHRTGLRWWYLTGLVIVSGMLTGVVHMFGGYYGIRFDVLWTYMKKTIPVDTCGGNPSLMTYCLDLSIIDDMTIDGVPPVWSSIFPWLLVFLLQQIAWTARRQPSFWNAKGLARRIRGWNERSSVFRHCHLFLWPLGTNMLWIGLTAWVLVLAFLHSSFLSQIARAIDMSRDSWTFSQIVAVLVWVPNLAKAIYFCICESTQCHLSSIHAMHAEPRKLVGVEEGMTHRLARFYRLVRWEEPDEENAVFERDDGDGDDLADTETVPPYEESPESHSLAFDEDRKRYHVALHAVSPIHL